MRRVLALLGALWATGCAAPARQAALSPCPPALLPVCHAGASGCESSPFCYRTLGEVDCYLAPEPARRTVEQIVAPAACPVALRDPAPPGRLSSTASAG